MNELIVEAGNQFVRIEKPIIRRDTSTFRHIIVSVADPAVASFLMDLDTPGPSNTLIEVQRPDRLDDVKIRVRSYWKTSNHLVVDHPRPLTPDTDLGDLVRHTIAEMRRHRPTKTVHHLGDSW